MSANVLVLPGDGIGAEIMPHVVRVLEHVDAVIDFEYAEVGGVAIDRYGDPLPPDALEAAKKADAVLLGAVGGPKWDDLPMDQRPEKALLGLRSGPDVFANLRPAILFEPLAQASSLKPELVAGLDDVDQMMRRSSAVGGTRLARADVEAPVDVTAIRPNDLGTEERRERHRHRRLAGGGRPNDRDKGNQARHRAIVRRAAFGPAPD